nr:adenylate/guanylate cyclase domain-containing protein [Ardenticatena sp.]
MFRLIHNHSRLALALADARLRLRHANATFCKWVGYDEIDGAWLPDLLPALVGVEHHLFMLAMQGGAPFTIPYLAHNGRFFDLSIEPVAIQDSESFLLITLLDVSDRARLEQELRQQRNELMMQRAALRRARDHLDYVLRRFVPSSVADALIEGTHAPTPVGEQRIATMFFADARGFTAVAEACSVEELFDVLNAHWAVLVHEIRAQGGTVIQYAGDMIMAAFNVPDAQPDHAMRATRAAFNARVALDTFAEQIAERGLPLLRFGFGLHTGKIMAGYVGGGEFYQYATIGDTTNVAFYLCTQAPPGAIYASHTTWSSLGNQVAARFVAQKMVKNRREPILMYELIELLPSV